MIALMISLVAMVGLANSSAIQKKQVTLTAILAAPKDRWDILLTGAVQKLKERHPNIDIKVDYKVLPYNVSRGQMIMALNNQTPIDLISVDQIWLGDFAQRGYITNLTGFVKSWGEHLIGIKPIWMEEYIMAKCMEYGLGLMYAVCGIGKIYYLMRALIRTLYKPGMVIFHLSKRLIMLIKSKG